MTAPTPTGARPSRLKRWALRLFVLALVAAALYAFRAPVLRTAGSFLVVEEAVQPGDAVLLFGADRGHERAAQWYRDGSTSDILVLEGPPGRLQRLGILDTAGVQARKALRRKGVPEAALTVIACPGRGDWNCARGLREWLSERPDVRVAVLCDRLNGRRARLIFRSVLGDALADRLRWCALPDRRFDETNWWQNKPGVRACWDGYLGLAHAIVYGEDPRSAEEWDPDQYEQTLPPHP
jgi:hypothetical protein